MQRVYSLSTVTYAGLAGLSVISLVGLARLFQRLQCKWRKRRIEREREIVELKEALGRAQREANLKKEGLVAQRKDLEDLARKLEEKERKVDEFQRNIEAIDSQLRRRNVELQRRDEELAQLRQEQAQMKQLLETRTLELKGAEAFLTKADTLSVADVVTMLEVLNSEIYQTAANVADAFKFKTKGNGEQRMEEDAAVMEEVYASANEIVGSRMVESLTSTTHGEDPMLVQIALQAGMSAYANWIITSWDLEEPDDEHGLNRLFKKIRLAEEQAVSGRWRALTRKYIPRMADHELSLYFVDAFVNILTAAQVSDSHASLPSLIESRFGDRISTMVRSAQRLRKAIGEEVTSCDLEILHVNNDAPFKPGQMDDTFASSDFEKGREGDEPELVLCTTDLGLVGVVRLPGKDGEWEETVLVRPKIVLKSGLDEMTAEHEQEHEV